MMLGSFSTDLIPAKDRLEAWRWNAQQICGDSRFHFPKSFRFHGSIEARRVAGLELTLFASSPLSFQKFPSYATNSDNRACIVITQLAGVRSYRQDGRTAVLHRGDTTLIDSGRPWSSDCPGDCARLYLRVPYFLMREKLGPSEVPIAGCISGAGGLGSILFGLSTSLFRQAGNLDAEEGAAAVDAYLGILAACVGEVYTPRLDRRAGEALFSRMIGYINNHLAEGDLGPTSIAAAMGISVRHVHRLFARQGHSAADWIQRQRLRACYSDLADPRQRHKSITEIAFSWGFNDSAHFSRVFRRHFAICPRAFRAGRPDGESALDASFGEEQASVHSLQRCLRAS